MPNIVAEIFEPHYVVATGQVITGPGQLAGFFCSTSGTVKLWDSTTGSGTVLVDTFSAVSGTFHPMPFTFTNGLFATMTTATGTFAIGRP